MVSSQVLKNPLSVIFWASKSTPSPDLNPIEEAFAKLKALLRRAGARTREALIEAMGRALDEVTAGDVRGFFEHRGYRVAAHLLRQTL